MKIEKDDYKRKRDLWNTSIKESVRVLDKETRFRTTIISTISSFHYLRLFNKFAELKQTEPPGNYTM